jgi:23S rRNA (adenine2503-C2)-methyltransferase
MHFFDHTLAELQHVVIDAGLPRHTATQVMAWIYSRQVDDLNAMSDLSPAAKEFFEHVMEIQRGRVVEDQSATDGTRKLLLEWPTSGLPIVGQETRSSECVMIPTTERKTACLSSQIGCGVGCTFCASGLGGLEGNLTAGQIVEQAWELGRLPGVGRLTNVVFMGMGEPLANFAEVTKAIRILHAPWGGGLGARRITVSTVGLPAAIRKLTAFEIPVKLALSLHAPNDELRRQLIPWAQFTTITELLDACQEYFQKTGREITLEYLLLGGCNDQPEHAKELADVAGRLRANVNLIRYNEVEGLPHVRPSTEDVLRFQSMLRARRVNVHIRASRGRDIAAACGQLRREHGQRN